MINFTLGVVVGTAFAPFWMWLYNTHIKPTIDSVLKK